MSVPEVHDKPTEINRLTVQLFLFNMCDCVEPSMVERMWED
jgi:hypothetical protein